MPHVQPARHALPKLNAFRQHPKAGPVRRSWNDLAGEAFLHLEDARVESVRRVHGPALYRRPRADLASALARREVFVGFRVAHRLGGSFDAHLLLEWLPVEAQRRAARSEKLPALAALVVRVEHEPLFVDDFEQKNANAWSTRAIDR